MVVPADAPTATDLLSSTDAPRAADVSQLQAVVAFVIAVAGAIVITGVSSLLRRRYEHSRFYARLRAL
jgi:hypothetical protein